MKRTFCYLAAAAALIVLGACTDTRKPTTPLTSDRSTDKVYTGVLPGADVDGIRYTVLLDFDDDGTEGDYDIVQTYFTTDSAGTVQDLASFADEGDFTVGTGANGQKYLKLSGDGSGEVYFLVDTDSTITMVDASLTPSPTPGMNYTLKSTR